MVVEQLTDLADSCGGEDFLVQGLFSADPPSHFRISVNMSELSDFECGQIVRMRMVGASISRVAEVFSVSRFILHV